ncbi:TPA: ComEC/Rec2 family competence protein [Stenotrophomonas maltophilia]|jgi:competence protein ComEC
MFVLSQTRMKTMDSDELYLLDVGHGNCALIKRGSTAIVIDAPSKPVLARALDELGITEISSLLISHADADHLSGGIALIMDESRPVNNIYVNPDPRKSRAWQEFRQAVRAARKRGTHIETSLNTNHSGRVSIGATTLTILHPTPELCLSTVEGVSDQDTKLTANNMSAVVRVDHAGSPVCLLAGDTDLTSLRSMMDDGVDLSAAVLVFPHHGGNAGGHDNKSFAKELTSTVNPELVFFSLGRGVHGTPQPDIISGVRESTGDVEGRVAPYIACTQLSTRCSSKLPDKIDRSLDSRSEGLAKNYCCAGTISVDLENASVEGLIGQLKASHSAFVTGHVTSPLCTRLKKQRTHQEIEAPEC